MKIACLELEMKECRTEIRNHGSERRNINMLNIVYNYTNKSKFSYEKQFLFELFHVPVIILRTFYAVFLKSLQQHFEVNVTVISILQIGKSQHREMK